MAERTFPSSARFGPGRARQDLQGRREEMYRRDHGRGRVLPSALRAQWLLDHAGTAYVEPCCTASLGSTYNRPRASVHAVLSLTFPRYLESGCISARLGCQQPSTASENPREEGKREEEGEEETEEEEEEGEEKKRKRRKKRRVPFLWSRNYASHINNVILSSSHV